MIFRQSSLTDTFHSFSWIKLGFVVELDTTVAQFILFTYVR